MLRNAVDRSGHWSNAVTAPLRTVRRALKSPLAQVEAAAASRLGESVKSCELGAERIEQQMLAALAEPNPCMPSPVDRAAAGRRNLSAYVRLTKAARSPGFSVSLLEKLVDLTRGPGAADRRVG